ncbi:hypothetical protein CPAR01_13529 [Colletotrichum paranaense]|uniref:Uncharacterized protein n=2 Tax=Colletotrichum acutatum species complex TaxID=2707335 RepID=A0ABQ9S3N6_9PEZI|nr:uncharacterized protein CPAR01_13529 [Colletotrichum paranaense]XP_060378010.1 uncharacterized protein CTAM01_11294 [Colletotrichum tamarilloi]KAK1488970.1 hypothetical protein CTAM01_11294 [Colletotrichum tamarilloi]KAK1524581.1 hypothetical protein CPAR01_13529 [Colletotrichum paranaense]
MTIAKVCRSEAGSDLGIICGFLGVFLFHGLGRAAERHFPRGRRQGQSVQAATNHRPRGRAAGTDPSTSPWSPFFRSRGAFKALPSSVADWQMSKMKRSLSRRDTWGPKSHASSPGVSQNRDIFGSVGPSRLLLVTLEEP